VVVGAILSAACGECQYAMFHAIIDASPGNNFIQTAKASQADIIFVKATVADTG